MKVPSEIVLRKYADRDKESRNLFDGMGTVNLPLGTKSYKLPCIYTGFFLSGDTKRWKFITGTDLFTPRKVTSYNHNKTVNQGLLCESITRKVDSSLRVFNNPFTVLLTSFTVFKKVWVSLCNKCLSIGGDSPSRGVRHP